MRLDSSFVMMNTGLALLVGCLGFLFYDGYMRINVIPALPLTSCVIEGAPGTVGSSVVGISKDGRRRQVLFTSTSLDELDRARTRLCSFETQP